MHSESPKKSTPRNSSAAGKEKQKKTSSQASQKKAKTPTSILDFAPAGMQLREVQEYALLQVEKHWSKVDVVVIEMPVGSGKSAVAYTLARWCASKGQGELSTRILAPTNILVEQYQTSMKGLHSLKGLENYHCPQLSQPDLIWNCKDTKAELGRTCSDCRYPQTVRKAHVYPYGVYNYWVYLAHRLYGDVVIFDECHKTVELIKELQAKKIWQHEYRYPSWVKTFGQLRKWLEGIPELETNNKLRLLHEELVSGETRFLVQRTQDLWHGQMRDVIKLLPVDVRGAPPVLWPNKVKKLVFLSATFGRKDIENLGLDRRQVLHIQTPSPIPVEQRPIWIDATLNMSWATQERNLPELVECLKGILRGNPARGFIHAPYSLAQKLAVALRDEPRLLFHDRENKGEVFQKFKDTPGAVMLASGMYEGVSLDEDLGRWQVITKIPWPSLAEPAIKWLAERDPEWYANETIRTLEQASGRICRGPTDYGDTIILDSSFHKLYKESSDLFHSWFRQACLEGSPEWLQTSKKT
jgi:Rad3-related DNA helicase